MRRIPFVLLFRTAVISCLICCTLALGGCSAAQLEERSFPMLATVDYGDGKLVFSYGFPALSQKDNTDLEEAKVNVPEVTGTTFAECLSVYEGEMSKKADCSHLKVLVLGKSLLQEKQAFYDVLDTLGRTEIYPRNTYVCVAEDLSALFDAEEQLPEDLGTYLEQFLQKHESDRQMHLENLGKLLDERKNRQTVVELPCLMVEDGAIVIHGAVKVDFR